MKFGIWVEHKRVSQVSWLRIELHEIFTILIFTLQTYITQLPL